MSDTKRRGYALCLNERNRYNETRWSYYYKKEEEHLDCLLEAFQQNVGMIIREDEHGSEADGLFTAL